MHWTCQFCTLHNQSTTTECVVCGNTRVLATSPEANSVSSAGLERCALPVALPTLPDFGSVGVQDLNNIPTALVVSPPIVSPEPSAPPKEAYNQVRSSEKEAEDQIWYNQSIDRILTFASSKHFKHKKYDYSFTADEFAQAFLKNGWSERKAVALQGLQKLLDNDFVHSVPYTLRPVVSFEQPLYRIGRRFYSKAKSTGNGRDFLNCSVCNKATLVELCNEGEWTCKVCTFRNASVSKEGEIKNHISPSNTLVSQGLNLVQNFLYQNAPSDDEIAETVRTAMQQAVLQQSADTLNGKRIKLNKADFLAVDRSLRQESSENDNIYPGILTSYAPLVMKNLRNIFGVSDDYFCESLFSSGLKFKENEGGASSSIFLFSEDKHFVVKSLTKHENSVLRSVLEEWYNYCLENPNTLLPRIYGLFKIAVGTRTNDIRYFMVLNNVFDTSLSIDRVYDLKGSTSSRFIEPAKQQEALKKTGKLPTLKDLNWNVNIRLSLDTSKELFQQISRDSQFLASLDIMDYSLLVGVHLSKSNRYQQVEETTNINRSRFQTFHGGLRCLSTGNVYFINIIDVLQKYDLSKKVERFMKTKVMTTVAGYMFRKEIQEDHVEEDVKCIYCGHTSRYKFFLNEELRTKSCTFRVTCTRCHANFNYASQVMQKLDQNVSSVDPKTYQQRFQDFVKTKVLAVA